MNRLLDMDVPIDPPWTVFRSRALDSISARRWSEASQALSEALVLAPRRELSELYALRSFLHLQLDEVAAAVDDASACLADDPHHGEALWWRGIGLTQLGEWDGAVRDLTHATHLAPSHQRAIREWLEQAVKFAVEAWKAGLKDRDAKERGAKDHSAKDHSAKDHSATADDFARRARWYLAVQDLGRAARDLTEAERLNPELALVFRGKAELARESRNWTEALAACERWAELEPSSNDALVLKVELLSEAGQAPAALQVLTELEERMGRSVADHLELIRLCRRVGNRLRSLYWCDRAQGEFGDWFPVLLNRGRVLMELRCWKSAAEQWRQIIRLRPDSLHERVELGRCLVKLRRFDDATRCFEESTALGPTFADVHAGLAHARWAARDSQGARAAAERSLRLDTTHLAGRVILSHLELAAGRIESGLAMLGEAWKRAAEEKKADPEWLGECAYAEGVGWLERGETERAIERFDAAIAQRPEHPGTWVWRAKAWARLARFDRCRRDLVTATRLNPSCDSQYRRLGQELARDFLTMERVRVSSEPLSAKRAFQQIIAFEMSGEDAEARRLFERTVPKLNDEFTWDWALLRLRLSLRQGDKAVERALKEAMAEGLSLDQILAIVDTVEPGMWRGAGLAWLEEQAGRFPNDGRLTRQLGVVYHLRGRAVRAANWLSRALALGQVDAETMALCGFNLQERGEGDEAFRHLTMALEQHPNQPTWLAWRGETLLKQERYDDAMRDFELSLTVDPAQVRAYCGRAMVLARRGEWEAALQWLTKALHRFTEPCDQAHLMQCRGRVYFNMRRYRRAIDDWDWAASNIQDEKELAELLFARAVARFHQGEMDRVSQDLERCLIAHPKHKGATVVKDWLDNKIERFPHQLTAPRRQIMPTRPMMGEKPFEITEPPGQLPPFPFGQWILRKSDGREFGPISQEKLLEWVSEGRVSAADWLLRADWNRWRRAANACRTWGFASVDRSEAESLAIDLDAMAGPPSIDNSTQTNIALDDSGVAAVGPEVPRNDQQVLRPPAPPLLSGGANHGARQTGFDLSDASPKIAAGSRDLTDELVGGSPTQAATEIDEESDT